MNILQINATDDPIGGASRIAFDLYSALKKEYVSKMIVGKKTQNGDDIRPIPKTFLQKALSYAFSNDISFFKTDFILDTKEFKEADIVHCHNLHGWYFNLNTLKKMTAKKPLVWTLHDMWAITPHCAHSYGESMVEGFYLCRSLSDYPTTLWNNDKRLCRRKRDIYNNSDFTIVVPSQWLYDKVKKSILGTKDICIIHNSVDTKIFTRKNKQKSRIELGLPMDKNIILFAANGGLDNIFKGGVYVRELIEKNRRDTSMVFVCIGGNEDKEIDNVIYRKKISSKGIMAQYLNACDSLVFPSIAENSPLIILEAMACGLPIVSFDVGGVKEILTHKENGFVARYGDIEDLLSGIRWLSSLSDVEKEEISIASSEKIKSVYDIKKMTAAYLNLYNKIYENKQKRS